jgi:hypothetical protein
MQEISCAPLQSGSFQNNWQQQILGLGRKETGICL